MTKNHTLAPLGGVHAGSGVMDIFFIIIIEVFMTYVIASYHLKNLIVVSAIFFSTEMPSSCKSLIVVCLVIIFIIVLLSTTGILFSSIHLKESLPDKEGTLVPVSVAGNFPAKIGRFDSYTTKDILVSIDPQEFQRNVRFYKNDCDQNRSYVVESPQIELPSISPIADSNIGFNYYSGDNPVYTSGTLSYITYNISASFSSNDFSSSECLMQLLAFDSRIKYLDFTESTYPTEGSYFRKSGCLPVGKDGEIENSTVTFHLPKAASYFVAISLKEGVDVHGGSVAVHAIEYNVTGLDVLQCSLNSFVDQCTFNFDNKFEIIPEHRDVCIWAESESLTTVNVSSSLNKNLAISYSILLSVSCIVLIVILFSVTITVCVRYSKIRQQERFGNEVEPLLEKQDIVKKNYNIQSHQS